MLLATGLVLLLGATPAASPPMKLAAPSFSAVQIDEKTARFLGEHFPDQLVRHGFNVTTDREVGNLLGLERQRQLLGCAGDASSCAAELASELSPSHDVEPIPLFIADAVGSAEALIAPVDPTRTSVFVGGQWAGGQASGGNNSLQPEGPGALQIASQLFPGQDKIEALRPVSVGAGSWMIFVVEWEP